VCALFGKLDTFTSSLVRQAELEALTKELDAVAKFAAIDRLVHPATILEMNVESYRRRAAPDRKRGPGRPPTHATIKEKR
jgi:hypothetical protein